MAVAVFRVRIGMDFLLEKWWKSLAKDNDKASLNNVKKFSRNKHKMAENMVKWWQFSPPSSPTLTLARRPTKEILPTHSTQVISYVIKQWKINLVIILHPVIFAPPSLSWFRFDLLQLKCSSFLQSLTKLNWKHIFSLKTGEKHFSKTKNHLMFPFSTWNVQKFDEFGGKNVRHPFQMIVIADLFPDKLLEIT